MAFLSTRLPLMSVFCWREGETLSFLNILLPAIAGPPEFSLDREMRDEEMVPGKRVLDVVLRLEVTLLDCLLVISGARLLDLGASRKELLDRGGGGAR